MCVSLFPGLKMSIIQNKTVERDENTNLSISHWRLCNRAVRQVRRIAYPARRSPAGGNNWGASSAARRDAAAI